MREPLVGRYRFLGRVFKFGGRLHDLWIVLAWTTVLTALMLNTFFHRACPEFLSNNLVATCQSSTDIGIIFVAGVFAGLALDDARIALTGFLFVELLASFFTVVAFSSPSLFGLQDPVLRDAVISRSLFMTLNYAFPFAIMSSFLGSAFGFFLEGRLGLS